MQYPKFIFTMLVKGREIWFILTWFAVASATSYTLSSVLSCIRPGDLIVVDWTASAAVTTQDWVGIYMAGRCNSVSCPSGSNAYTFVSISGGINTNQKGVVAITAPSVGGTYSAYYLPNNQYTITAMSNSFTVSTSCPPVYTIGSLPSCVTAGSTLTVPWTTAPPGAGSQDWIGVYASGRCSATSCPSGSDFWKRIDLSASVTGGSLQITIPSSAVGKSLSAYYLINDLYQIGAVSPNMFTVQSSCAPATGYTVGPVSNCVVAGTTIGIPWTAPGQGAAFWDWIGVYKQGRCTGTTCPSGSDFWQRILTGAPNTANQGNLWIDVPASAAGNTYQAYFLLNDQYSVQAASVPFTVQTSCPRTAPSNAWTVPALSAGSNTVVAGGFLKISWSNANPADLDDWIVFTKSGAPSDSSIYPDCWQYTYGDTIRSSINPTASGSVSVKAPAIPGTYQVYYCIGNSYTCPTSLTITVTAPKVTCRPAGQTASNVKHVITIISENHSFDSYFGRYCTAPFGSKPTCNVGRNCCETASADAGASPSLLNDAQNENYDPNHSTAGEVCAMNGGRMDKYTQGCGSSDKRNYAMADGSVGSASQYWGWASHYAMSDRFFQSAPGASSQGEMFFARGAFVFKDNSFYPATSVGLGKTCPGNCMTYDDPTIGDLLLQCNVPFKFYHVGWPNSNDPTDDAFLYYEKIANGPNAKSIFVEYGQLANDIANGNLPPVSYVKASYSGGVTGGGQTEHPGSKTSISDGENFNAVIINQILSSPLYRDNTVIFLVPDESGGFRDSVTPPPRSDVDNKLYGPRTQFLAVSNLVNKNYVSHVVTEPASLIRFIESNWFADAQPGHLHTRDAVAGSLNDLFDPTLVGFTFP